MTTRRLTVLALSLTVPVAGLVAGCAQQAKDGIQEIKQTNSRACVENRRVFEAAVESFTMLVGHTPTEAEMVPDYLRIESPYYDIDASGNVVPSPTGGCDN